MSGTRLRKCLTFSQYCLLRQNRARVRLSLFTRTLTTENQRESDDRMYVDGNGQLRMRKLEYDELYPGHIPTSNLQKVLLSIGSAGMSLLDPSRDDMIATLGETTGTWALRSIKQKMEADPTGQRILQEQPLINTNTVSIDYLGSLPEGTFGKKYWHFLSKNGFSPDARLPIHFVDDPELKYVMLRYRQVHDLFHSILGMPPHMLGEVAVKWVEALQTGLPMCVLGALFGPLRLGPKHTKKYLDTYLPWAIRNGQNAKFLMAVYWEEHWEDNLEEFRQQLNIEPPPITATNNP